MGALLGIINGDKRPVDTTLLMRMAHKMRWRGPEREGYWVDGPVGLGSFLLQATPESFRETQPLADEQGRLVAVFDGRLDNREELGTLLPQFEIKEDTVTDAAMILAAYENWREATPKYLLGDFAFAIWDKGKRRLFLARDPIGVKPLYYYWDGKRFLFSSEILPFFEDPSIQKRPDEFNLVCLLVGESPNPDATFFEGIKQLPPAHFLILEEGKNPRIERYWHVNPKRLLNYRQREDYEEEFFSLFEKSVLARLRSPAPVGNLLSGGLDSTQVTAMAEALRRKRVGLPPLVSTTWLCHSFLEEECEALQSLKKTYDADIQTFGFPSGETPKSNMEFFISVGETPHTDVFTMPPFLLEYLRSRGCKVFLTGFGANELGFYPEIGSLQDLFLSFRWIKLFREIRRVSKALQNKELDVARWIFLESLREKAPSFIRYLARKRMNHKRNWINDRFRRLMPVRPRPRGRRFPTLAQESPYRKLTDPWFALGLNQMDSLASKFSMEIRHPFLDRRLIEFLLAIPGEVKIEGGYRKMFFQRALKKIVPGPIREVEKEQYFVPDEENERNQEFQRARLKTYLSNPEAFIYRYVVYSKIQAMIQDVGKDFWYNHALLWRFVRLESWFQEFFPATEKKEVEDERHYSGLSVR